MGRPSLILLDTHVVLWLAFAPDKISRRAQSAIEESLAGSEGLSISDITLLELATLAHKGRVHLNISLESFLQEVENRFVVLPMNGEICARSLQLPETFPNDPADRVIAATALVRGFPLVTADNAIRRSKALQILW
jgi:PIN domain nuclease of toxin-antitoxin system